MSKNHIVLAVMILFISFKQALIIYKLNIYSQTCLQQSTTGNNKVAFVDKWPLFRASETTYPIFTGQINTGLCRLGWCCFAQV